MLLLLFLTTYVAREEQVQLLLYLAHEHIAVHFSGDTLESLSGQDACAEIKIYMKAA